MRGLRGARAGKPVASYMQGMTTSYSKHRDQIEADRQPKGLFGERARSAPEVGVQYPDGMTSIPAADAAAAAVQQKLDVLASAQQELAELERELTVAKAREVAPHAAFVQVKFAHPRSPVEFRDESGNFILDNDAEDALESYLREAAPHLWETGRKVEYPLS